MLADSILAAHFGPHGDVGTCRLKEQLQKRLSYPPPVQKTPRICCGATQCRRKQQRNVCDGSLATV
jgi:hypothetical protein